MRNYGLRIIVFSLLLLGVSIESKSMSMAQNTSSRWVKTITPAHDEMDMSKITPEQAIQSLPEPMHLSDINVWESVREHVHNKLVHFPLALGLLACLFWLLSSKQSEFQNPAKFVLVLSASTGLLAVITGENQKQVFQDSPLVEIMQWHEKSGFFSLFLLLTGSVWQWFQSFRKFIWVYVGLMVVALLFTGFLGGLLSHSHLEPVNANQSHQESFQP